jgi:DNA-binding NarL/FixJ family response regulator
MFTPMAEVTPIAIVEDDDAVLGALAALVDGTDELRCVGAFASAEDFLTACDRGLRARIVLVDLALPGLSGRALLAQLGARLPGADGLVLTALDDEASLFGALQAGAVGYLLKDADDARILAALREVLDGGSPMSPGIARRVIAQLRSPSAPGPAVQEASAHEDGAPLTARESAVLELLARGHTYDSVGRALGIALGTVQYYVRAIYRKLEVASKAEATAEAYRRGLIA